MEVVLPSKEAVAPVIAAPDNIAVEELCIGSGCFGYWLLLIMLDHYHSIHGDTIGNFGSRSLIVRSHMFGAGKTEMS